MRVICASVWQILAGLSLLLRICVNQLKWKRRQRKRVRLKKN